MLEKIPEGVGYALRGVRAGYDKIVGEDAAFASAPEQIILHSPAFEDGGAIPSRFTNDGEQISAPLAWSGVPEHAAGLVLIVEDPDAPSPEPLVHLLAWDLPPHMTTVDEGVFRSARHGGLDENLGRNSFLQTAWWRRIRPGVTARTSTSSNCSHSIGGWSSTIRPAAARWSTR